jgi:hypothetical protein
VRLFLRCFFFFGGGETPNHLLGSFTDNDVTPPSTNPFRYGPGSYALAISLVERGLIDLKPLVTHRYEFKDALEAFKVTEQGKDASGKVGSFGFFLLSPSVVAGGGVLATDSWREFSFGG